MRACLALARAACQSFAPQVRVHLCVREPVIAERLQQGAPGLWRVPEMPSPLALFLPQRETSVEPVREQAAALGYGQAALLCPMGEGRIAELIEAAQALHRDLQIFRGPDCDAAPRPRFFGGLRFAPQSLGECSTADDPWRGLPDAHFVLPRWTLLLQAGEGYLQLNTTVAELLDGAPLEAELRRLEEALAAKAPTSDAPLLVGQPVGLQAGEAERWYELVERALHEITAGRLHKVVLARGQVVPAPASSSAAVAAVLTNLTAAYPTCMRFALPLVEACLVGATPELLVARQGASVRCDALAGSLPRRNEGGGLLAPSIARQAQTLLSDEKEGREHAHVVAALCERLRPFVGAIQPSAPQPRVLRNVIHLWTPLSAELTAPTHVLQLLAALHPTPAVCGVPQQAAARFICAQEALPRGYYAAPVGWFDGAGDGEFYVAIRSALLRDGQAFLFAGAGIVAGSQPAKEFRETAAKLQPMLAALGLLSDGNDPVGAAGSPA